MVIAIYGGSFDPPHIGHIETAKAVSNELSPDLIMIFPCLSVSGKDTGHLNDYADVRLQLCREAFKNIPRVVVSDFELKKNAISYTADTVKHIRHEYPDAELLLVTGRDKLENINKWYNSDYIFSNCKLVVSDRKSDFKYPPYLTDLYFLHNQRIDISSENVRDMLSQGEGNEYLSDTEYSLIVKNRWYDSLPNIIWLRNSAYSFLKESRKAHVLGCEKTAIELAEHYGCDSRQAQTAAILHDITKKLDLNAQLILCSKYDIICDDVEKSSEKLLHAKTGAYFSKDLYGIEDDIFNAIFWHTTGKPEMSLLEKVIYIADYIEPTRDFPGVDALRKKAFENIDSAMLLGLKMSLDDLTATGVIPHINTQLAYEFYKEIAHD